MSPEQALQILVQASQAALMPAQAHIQCQQAADILISLVRPADKKK